MMNESDCAYLARVPENLMECYPEYRFEQKKADKITDSVIEYIANEKLIKGIIAGHLHINHEGLFAERIPQIVTFLHRYTYNKF